MRILPQRTMTFLSYCSLTIANIFLLTSSIPLLYAVPPEEDFIPPFFKLFVGVGFLLDFTLLFSSSSLLSYRLIIDSWFLKTVLGLLTILAFRYAWNILSFYSNSWFIDFLNFSNTSLIFICSDSGRKRFSLIPNGYKLYFFDYPATPVPPSDCPGSSFGLYISRYF